VVLEVVGGTRDLIRHAAQQLTAIGELDGAALRLRRARQGAGDDGGALGRFGARGQWFRRSSSSGFSGFETNEQAGRPQRGNLFIVFSNRERIYPRSCEIQRIWSTALSHSFPY
jgi:hypothetical protein